MYVSNGQMLSMFMAPIVPLLVAAGGCILLYHYSDKKRVGILHGVGFGILAYIWQLILNTLVTVLITKYDWLRNVVQSNVAISSLIYALINSVFVAIGLVWGVRIATRSQKSLTRKYSIKAVSVGIGFGVFNTVWNLVIPYGESLYYSARINTGSFVGSDELAQSVFDTRPGIVLLDSLKGVYLLILYMALALLVSGFLRENKKWNARISVTLAQFVLFFTNALFRNFAAESVTRIGMQIFLLAVTVWAVWYLWRWMKTLKNKRLSG